MSDYFELNSEFLDKEAKEIKERETKRESFRQGRVAPDGESLVWWTPPPGDSVIRFGPPWSKDGIFVKKVYKHFGIPEVTVRNTLRNKLTCPALTFEGAGFVCPICDTLISVSSEASEEVKEQVKRMSAKFRGTTNILVLESPTGETHTDHWVIYEFPPTVYEWLISQIKKPKIGNITHPETGFDVSLERKGKTQHDTRYDPNLLPDRTPIADSKAARAELLSKLVNLDKLYRSPDDEYIRALRTAAGKIKARLGNRGEGGSQTFGSRSANPVPSVQMSKTGKAKPKECFEEFTPELKDERNCQACPHVVPCLHGAGVELTAVFPEDEIPF